MSGTRSRSATVCMMVGASVSLLAGCASEGYGGVLWRQIAAYKDHFGQTLVRMVGTDRDAFIGAMESQYPDVASEPTLEQGGLVIFDTQEEPDSVTFSVLISSGPRNAAADPFADSRPYAGPPSIYTCFAVAVDYDATIVTGWTRSGHECDSGLVATLEEGARLVPVAEFDG